MINVMLDLETLGTVPGSVILSVGAVVFSAEKLGAEFYTAVNFVSCVYAGLTITEATQTWWSQQSEEARKVLTVAETPTTPTLQNALAGFSGWLEKLTDAASALGLDAQVAMWGNGADFDNALVAVACAKVGLELPWKFYNSRCYRTLKSFAPEVKLERTGTYHNALDDAKSQALHAIALAKHLGLKL